MAGIFNKISAAARNHTTYQVGLLQAKAYRVLKQHTSQALEKFEISTVQWAFLGLLYGNPQGLKPMEIAKELGVKAPFVTSILNDFEKDHLVDVKADEKDTRAKVIRLTKEGKRFVTETESYLRTKMRPLLTDVSMNDLMTYLSVLEKMTENAGTDKDILSFLQN